MNVIQQRTVRGYEEHVKIHTHFKNNNDKFANNLKF